MPSPITNMPTGKRMPTGKQKRKIAVAAVHEEEFAGPSLEVEAVTSNTPNTPSIPEVAPQQQPLTMQGFQKYTGGKQLMMEEGSPDDIQPMVDFRAQLHALLQRRRVEDSRSWDRAAEEFRVRFYGQYHHYVIPFPVKLHKIVSCADLDDMFWLEDGRSFAIDREGYKKNLMSVFFRQNKFTSLQSNMSRYGFARELDSFDGLVFVVYSHPSGHFVQEDPDQSIKICPLPKPIDYRAAATSNMKPATSKRGHGPNTGMGQRAQEDTLKISHQPPEKRQRLMNEIASDLPDNEIEGGVCSSHGANQMQGTPSQPPPSISDRKLRSMVSEDEVSNGSTKGEGDMNPGHAPNDNFEKAAVSTHMEAKYDTKSDHKEPAAAALSAPSTPKGTTDTRRAAAKVWQSDKDIEDRRDMIVKM